MDRDRQTGYARALRRDMTREERRLWYDFLRTYPVRFMRQRPIDRYILDFYCAAAKLAVELDGSQHYDAAGPAADAERDAVLRSWGITVLRIPNNAITENFPGVCEAVDAAVRARLPKKP